MKIVTESALKMSKDEISNISYKICKSTDFPVDEEDVYDHLFGNSDSVSKYLINEKSKIVGFEVAQEYPLMINDIEITLTYLQGMVISKEYQGKGYSIDMLKSIYNYFKSDLFGLRTQNPKMAKAILGLFDNTLLRIPENSNQKLSKFIIDEFLPAIRTIPAYKDIDNTGIVRNCYSTQLCLEREKLESINSNVILGNNDALAVIVAPIKHNLKKILSK